MTLRLISRVSHDWRLMRHVTLLEEDTHGRDCEWQGTELEFALPLQLPQTFISALLEMREKNTPQKKKKKKKKKTRGREAKWQLLENFSPQWGDKQLFHRSFWLPAPPDRRQLFWRPSPLPKSEVFKLEAWMTLSNVTTVINHKRWPPVKAEQLLFITNFPHTHCRQIRGTLSRVQRFK